MSARSRRCLLVAACAIVALWGASVLLEVGWLRRSDVRDDHDDDRAALRRLCDGERLQRDAVLHEMHNISCEQLQTLVDGSEAKRGFLFVFFFC